MKRGSMFLLLPVIISLSLLASFLITAPVFAQDELPPEAPVPTEIIPVVEENPIVEPAPPEVAPPEEAVLVEEAPVEEPALDTLISEEGAVEVPFEQNPAEDPYPRRLKLWRMRDLFSRMKTGNRSPGCRGSGAQASSNGDPVYDAGTVYIGWSAGDTCPAPSYLPAAVTSRRKLH